MGQSGLMTQGRARKQGGGPTQLKIQCPSRRTRIITTLRYLHTYLLLNYSTYSNSFSEEQSCLQGFFFPGSGRHAAE